MTRFLRLRLRLQLQLQLALALFVVCALMSGGSTLAADDFGSPVAGQHVYDRSGILTTAERADLEQRAAAMEERVGGSTIVYLRLQDATQNQTETSARELMDAWNVQSAPDARDGFVVFLNLNPGDPRHGRVALYAGQRHVNDGTLTESTLEGIIDRQMVPRLADGHLADGIAAGLDVATATIAAGPPPPSPIQQLASSVAPVLSVLALVLAAVQTVFVVRTWRARPSIPAVAATTVPPSELAPALAGALVAGRVIDAQFEATLLELARRGALAIEPAAKKQTQVRLVHGDLARSPLEQAVWSAVAAQADGLGVVAAKRVSRIRYGWNAAGKVLQADLEQRGWFDTRIGQQRRPLFISGVVAIVLGAVGLATTFIARDLPGVIGPVLLVTTGFVAIFAGALLPATTAEGAYEASPWRAYREGLKQSKRVPEPAFDLDAALPYAVALGSAGAIEPHLKRASNRGYAPAWFVRGRALQPDDVGFYPYWVGFHSAVAPSSSGGGSSSGASAGGAGASGSF